jgi:hypothetical protein
VHRYTILRAPLVIVRAQGRAINMRPWIFFVHRDDVFACVPGNCACAFTPLFRASLEILPAQGHNFRVSLKILLSQGRPFCVLPCKMCRYRDSKFGCVPGNCARTGTHPILCDPGNCAWTLTLYFACIPVNCAFRGTPFLCASLEI